MSVISGCASIDPLADVVGKERAVEARCVRDPESAEDRVGVAKVVCENERAAVLNEALKVADIRVSEADARVRVEHDERSFVVTAQARSSKRC